MVALPLAWAALLFAQAVSGGSLPPFFVAFEAELARLPKPERARRLGRELTVGTAFAVAGLVLLAGGFLLASALSAPIVTISPGLLAYGVLRALRAMAVRLR